MSDAEDSFAEAPNERPPWHSHLITLAVHGYRDDNIDISSQLGAVTSWWGDFAHREVKISQGRRELRDAVEELGLQDKLKQDVVVLYVTAHGAGSAHHYLLLPHSDPERLPATAYRTSELVLLLWDSGAQHILIIVDSCYSGMLQKELDRMAEDLAYERRENTAVVVLATAGAEERPRTGEFAQALQRAHEHFRLRAGIVTETLTMDEFLKALHHARDGSSAATLVYPNGMRVYALSEMPSPCLPNPGYQPRFEVVDARRRQVATSESDLAYWIDKASGQLSSADSGWYFAGRRQLTAEVAAFLASRRNRHLVVTGAAATGKSAIIARAVTLSDPKFRAGARYHDAIAAAPPETIPEPGAIDVALLARNKDSGELLADLVEALGGEATLPGLNRVPALRTQLTQLMAPSDAPWTIALDALDESHDPFQMISNVIAPLAYGGGGNVRWLIGIRSTLYTSSSDNRPLDDSQSRQHHPLFEHLLRALPAHECKVVRTDDENITEDIRSYVDALLDHPDSPYRNNPGIRHETACMVTQLVAPSFLDAQLAGHRLRSRSTMQNLHDPRWRATLADHTTGLLRADLNDSATEQFPASHLLAVLRASAFALGAGLPWAEIWPAVIEVVLDGPIPDCDSLINAVLAGRLSGYLARDIQDNRIVYRPAHERLAEILRDQPHRLLAGPKP